jgi:hypothetical protein
MSKLNFSKLLIPIALIAIIGYFSYAYFLKDIILNNSTQTIELKDFGLSKAYNLKKHDGQSSISSLEIELSGTSKDNLYLVFGPTKDQLLEQIQLKKGTIDFQKSSEWKTDNCYFLIINEKGESVDLKLDYRFIH